MQVLTDREREILDLIAAGFPSKAIAAELGIAESTVKWHVARLLERYSASSRSQLVAILIAEIAPADPAAAR